MWKQFWKTWTIDKPAAFGDWLWDVFVVQFAAWLDRLTLRQVITLVLILILFLAYLNRIPLHPGIVLIGDMLAYIDIFAALFLLSILSRFTTMLFVVKQMSARVLALARGLRVNLRRLDFRHRREGSANARRRPVSTRSDDEDGVGWGVAWA